MDAILRNAACHVNCTETLGSRLLRGHHVYLSHQNSSQHLSSPANLQELVCSHNIIKRLAAAVKTGLQLVHATSNAPALPLQQLKHRWEACATPRAGLMTLLCLQDTLTGLLLAWAGPGAVSAASTAASRAHMARQLVESGAHAAAGPAGPAAASLCEQQCSILWGHLHPFYKHDASRRFI